MNTDLMHDLTFYAMYGATAIALFIVVERSLYFAYTRRQAQRLVAAISASTRFTHELPAQLQRDSLPLKMLEPVLRQKQDGSSQKALDEVIDAQYLSTRAPLARSLWIIETIATAAPLLGLLGTIFGIMDTFKALAASGVSDPGQVSAGIGTALFATGLGIAIALGCIIFHNFFQDRLDRINDLLKILLIRASSGADVVAVPNVPMDQHSGSAQASA